MVFYLHICDGTTISNLHTKFTHEIYTQNLHTKFTHKIYTRNLHTKFTHKIYTQNLHTKFNVIFYVIYIIISCYIIRRKN